MTPDIEIKVRIEGLVAERILEQQQLFIGILSNMYREIKILRREVKNMAADQAALDAAIAEEILDVQDVATKINSLASADATAFADLQAKIAANPTAPASDFTDEVNKLAGNHTSLTSASAALVTALAATQTADPGAPAATGTTATTVTTDAGTGTATS